MFYFLKQVYKGENNLWKFHPSSSPRNARASDRKMVLLQPVILDLLRHNAKCIREGRCDVVSQVLGVAAIPFFFRSPWRYGTRGMKLSEIVLPLVYLLQKIKHDLGFISL